MPNLNTFARLIVATLVAIGSIACASSREVVVGTDPGAATAGGQAGGATVSNASLESELLRLAVTQEAYYEAKGYYAADLDAIDYTPAAGVRMDLIQGDSDGFSAIARAGDAECALFSGDVRSPRGYATTSGMPACRS